MSPHLNGVLDAEVVLQPALQQSFPILIPEN
jgi:hypothetical protein